MDELDLFWPLTIDGGDEERDATDLFWSLVMTMKTQMLLIDASVSTTDEDDAVTTYTDKNSIPIAHHRTTQGWLQRISTEELLVAEAETQGHWVYGRCKLF